MEGAVIFDLLLIPFGIWILYEAAKGITAYRKARRSPDDLAGVGEKAALVGILGATVMAGCAALYLGVRGLLF